MTCEHDKEVVCPDCRPDLWCPAEGLARLFTIDYLVKEILAAKKAYYESGSSSYTDGEYDGLEKSLRAYDPDNIVLKKVGKD